VYVEGVFGKGSSAEHYQQSKVIYSLSSSVAVDTDTGLSIAQIYL